jgi:hypothetical protein
MSGIFSPSGSVLSATPPSSPFIGMKWTRVTGGVPEEWTWDGTRWLSDPMSAIAIGTVSATSNFRAAMSIPGDYDLLFDQCTFMGRPAQAGSNGGAPTNTNTDYHEFRLWPTASNGSQIADFLVATSQNSTLTAGIGWAYSANVATSVAHKGWVTDVAAIKMHYLQFRVVKIGANAGNTFDLGTFTANARYIYS